MDFHQESKIIFLYSQSPRSGHNFVADVIRCVSSSYTPLGDRSEIAFAPLLHAYDTTIEKEYSSKGTKELFNSLFISQVRNNILSLSEEKNVFIKYTQFSGAENCKYYFPDDIHIVSLRDPKDCLISLFKGMNLKSMDYKTLIKKIVLPFGIYHYSYSRKYANRLLKIYPDLNQFYVVRYEDLVMRNKKVIKQMQNWFENSESVDRVIELMNQIQVINTSFYKEETESKSIWDAKEVTEKFKPIGRKNGFNKFQLLGISLGCRSLRKKMGYL